MERQRFGCRSIVFCMLVVSVVARADEFAALPGLWKTTFSTDPAVLWHCVDEDADPWISFAHLEDPPGMTCAKLMQERTSTSLRWRFSCRAQGARGAKNEITAEGTIVFDAPDHYTGKVGFAGQLLGFPLHSSQDVEGRRYAACTSPRD